MAYLDYDGLRFYDTKIKNYVDSKANIPTVTFTLADSTSGVSNNIITPTDTVSSSYRMYYLSANLPIENFFWDGAMMYASMPNFSTSTPDLADGFGHVAIYGDDYTKPTSSTDTVTGVPIVSIDGRDYDVITCGGNYLLMYRLGRFMVLNTPEDAPKWQVSLQTCSQSVTATYGEELTLIDTSYGTGAYASLGLNMPDTKEGTLTVRGEAGEAIVSPTCMALNASSNTQMTTTPTGLQLDVSGATKVALNSTNGLTLAELPVSGASEISGDTIHAMTAFKAHVDATSATYGVGKKDQVLTSNGTRSYWKDPSTILATNSSSGSNFPILLTDGANPLPKATSVYKNINVKVQPSTGTIFAKAFDGASSTISGTSSVAKLSVTGSDISTLGKFKGIYQLKKLADRRSIYISKYRDGSAYNSSHKVVDGSETDTTGTFQSGIYRVQDVSELYGLWHVMLGTVSSTGLFSGDSGQDVIIGWSRYSMNFDCIAVDHTINSVAARTYRKLGFSLYDAGDGTSYLDVTGDVIEYDSGPNYRPCIKLIKLADFAFEQ